jgi:hypothetical protein
MLAANAELDVGAGLAAALGGDLDHLPDTGRVERHERVVLEDPELLVGAAEARRIVARDAVDGLRQIVGAEAEKGGALGDLARRMSNSRRVAISGIMISGSTVSPVSRMTAAAASKIATACIS